LQELCYESRRRRSDGRTTAQLTRDGLADRTCTAQRAGTTPVRHATRDPVQAEGLRGRAAAQPYRAIDRLARDELIEPAETTREGNRPERTVYRITDEGRQEFYSRIGQLISAPALDSPSFAVALSFAGYFPDTAILHALTARVPQLEGEIAGLSAVSQLAEAHVQRVALLEQEYLHAIRAAELTWTKSVIEDLRSGRLTWDSAAAIHDPRSLVNNLVNNEDTGAERRRMAGLRAIGDERPRRS
jgi:DNA-binding PadR family transcriptional regulator